MKGYIHSIESFGTVDGPGIRMVVFFQGCPMRCLYCHNPDTWKMSTGSQMTVDEILSVYDKNIDFYKHGGGITVTGGEALTQIDFLIKLFMEAKKRKIHTCLDTSGVTFHKDNEVVVTKFEKLLNAVDLIMLDIKHINPHEHKKLTGHPLDNILDFADFTDKRNIPLWIRHVVVPTITDNETYLSELGYYIGGLKNIKALDVLPYHSMGKLKYKELGIDYPLKNIPDLDEKEIATHKKNILRGIKKRRSELIKPTK